MKKTSLSLPQLSLIAATRVALGTGLGLLYSEKFTRRQRSVVGWALFLAGVISTVPLGRMVLEKRCKVK